jgi:heme/copper-type cytochrome/quinol oxidase subunit 3
VTGTADIGASTLRPGTLVPAVTGAEDEGAARATATVGMIVALAAIAMTFAALLLAYAIVRVQAPAWPPPGEVPLAPLWSLRLGATALALAGSAAMHVAGRAGRVGPASPAHQSRALGAATAAGVAFVVLQVASLRALGAAGVHPSSGLAASVVYALTAFHGLHALVAVLFSLALLVARRPARPGRLLAVVAFWHLVTAVWLIVFGAVFVA